MSPASPDASARLSPGSHDSGLNSPKTRIKAELTGYGEFESSANNHLVQRHSGDSNKRKRGMCFFCFFNFP